MRPIRPFVTLLIGCISLAGCSDDGANSAPAAPEPAAIRPSADPEEAVRRAATAQYRALDNGEWSDAWDLWTKEAQGVIEQDEFAQVYRKCKPVTQVGFSIESVQIKSDLLAVVSWRRSTLRGSHELILEGGEWRFRPSDSELADYRLGRAQLIKKKSRDGSCG